MAIGASTVSDIGGAVSDLFAASGAKQSADIQAQGTRLKAQGDLSEAQEYDLAQKLSLQNEQYTKTSTGIQQAQQQRNTTLQIGGQQAQIAGAGFAASGSALDILADSASQGALAKATLGQQGLITEAGYEEQGQSYGLMSSAARSAAAEEDQIASEQEKAGKTSMWGDIAGSLLKGAGAVAGMLVGGPMGSAVGSALGGAAASAVGDAAGSGGLY